MLSSDVFDQDGMVVGLDEYLEGMDDTWDDRYECGCCMCCGCSCDWMEDDLSDDKDECD